MKGSRNARSTVTTTITTVTAVAFAMVTSIGATVMRTAMDIGMCGAIATTIDQRPNRQHTFNSVNHWDLEPVLLASTGIFFSD